MKSTFFLALLVLFAFITISTSVPVPTNPAPKSGSIQVTSPTKGPWARYSYQAVSWNANVAVPNQWQQTVHVYIYQVVANGTNKLIDTLPDKPYGNTWDGFQITDKYPLDGKFYALVSGPIQVTAPTKGPWARYSYQSVSWNANVAVPNQWQQTVHVYIYQVASSGPDKLIQQLPDKPYGNTWDGFQITDKYPLDGKFYALVVLASDSKIYGTSEVFTIFKTAE
ncbi:4680_t:CDS:2 [Ambispora gerdemannii]|uniref:4680_t:CDS:1 n=1 Tax=Ambispora gerdemannii TaxID=144530 RepID=A0A9N9BFR8_9GLOM|nr:4680_t:CDS:2 [Ambispora gerdemannii]